ncbi:MAG: hypothetical protein KIT58_14040 [Planctomycetota bacterium]|nr:hypothetical protein [Planctomycetota bacterium]
MSQVAIQEGTTLKLDVRLKKGTSKSGKATFKFRRIGPKLDETDEQEVDVSKSWLGPSAKVSYVVPDVPDGMDGYEVFVSVEADGRSKELDKCYAVWHAKARVKAFKEGKQGAMPKAKFVVYQGEKKVGTITAGDDGVGECDLPKAAPWRVEVDTPFKLVAWDDVAETKRVRECELRQTHPLEIVDPKKPDDGKPRRQYVNDTSEDEGADGKGRFVKLKAQTKDDASLGKQGDEVFVRVTFTNPTKRTKPDRMLVGVDLVKDDARSAPRREVFNGRTALGDDGTVTLTVALGVGGGERCLVEVGSTEACSDDRFELESWRQVYYQVTVAEGLDPKPALDLVNKGLNHSFIMATPMEEEFTTIPADDGGCPPGSWCDGTEIGKSAGKVLRAGSGNNRQGNDDALHTAYFKYAGHDKEHLIAHLIFIHYMCDIDCGDGTQRISGKKEFAEKHKIEWPPGSGTKAYGFHIRPRHHHPQGFAEKWRLFATSYRRGSMRKGAQTDSVYMAQWQCKAKNKAGDIPADHVKYLVGKGADSCYAAVKFPDDAVKHLDDGEELTVSYYADFFTEPYCGMSDGKNIILINGTADKKAVANTIVHEIGHGIGMCCDKDILKPSGKVDKIPDLPDPRGEHGRWYEDHGDQGDHCANAVNELSYKKLSSSMLWRGDCVIFGHDQPLTMPLKFCGRCDTILRAMEVSFGPLDTHTYAEAP